MASVFYDCALFHQNKTPVNFLCKQGLNLISLIQLSETLLVQITETHKFLH